MSRLVILLLTVLFVVIGTATTYTLKLKKDMTEYRLSVVSAERDTATDSLEKHQRDIERNVEALKDLVGANLTVYGQEEKNTEILSKHNLTALAQKKPALIEIRINKGTEDAFKNISTNSGHAATTRLPKPP